MAAEPLRHTDPIETVTALLRGVKSYKEGYMAFCPAHEDGSTHGRRSLKIDRGRDGRALLSCFAGCEADDICHAIGLELGDLFHDDGRRSAPLATVLQKPRKRTTLTCPLGTVASYDYPKAGRLLFRVFRIQTATGKTFRQWSPHPDGGWWEDIQGVERVLYHHDELVDADPDALVFLVEGEKDADALCALGLLATTPPMGAGKWIDRYAAALSGRSVAILPDNDDVGRRHAETVAASLVRAGCLARIVALPGLPEKGDVSDWLDAGGTADDFLSLTDDPASWAPWTLPVEHSQPVPITPRDTWPAPLAPEALHGLAGDVVRAIEPHTEGDPAAVLINFLVLFGNAVGRTPHCLVSGRRHHANENAVLVGNTSKGRKGSSHDYPLLIVAEADHFWRPRVMGGLSSGEGLVWQIRDPVESTNKKGETFIADQGVEDKRLVAVEEEFSGVCKVATRDGNTITETIRRAWDGQGLGGLTKNSPTRCAAPHVSILGHVTRDELLRVMDSSEAANGFGNRFLWIAVRRSRLLPEGGNLTEHDRAPLVDRTRDALDAARRIGLVSRDAGAKRLWAEIYGDLSEPGVGLFGAMTDRSEAHVLRLSLLYALLDGRPLITEEHLLAALAVWDYASASARHIFGDALGDQVADRILSGLRQNGPMDQTEISELFGRNVGASRLSKALELLLTAGRATFTREAPEGRGRPRTVWKATA